MRLRIGIREQLCLVIALTSLLSLTVLAVATWTQAHRFLIRFRASTLSLTANLKATQIAEDLSLYQDLVQAVSTRTSVQSALALHNSGNDSDAVLQSLQDELTMALSGGIESKLLLQAAVFPRSNRTESGGRALANATGEGAIHHTVLPATYPNGTQVYLGDPGVGYPPSLYPNYTWSDEISNVSQIFYQGRPLYYNSTLLLGPLYLNRQSALISISVAINNNTSRSDILGWLTVVLDARILYNVASTAVGLGDSGETLVLSPVPSDNLFPGPIASQSASMNSQVPVNFILPPSSLKNRHSQRVDHPDLAFPMGDYPCVFDAWSKDTGELNNAGSHISSHNEQNKHISCGYARVPSDIVDWAVVLEQSYGEVVAPIRRFRDIVLACIFAVLGAVVLVCLPLAHYAVKPIRALKTATENSVLTYEAEVLKETASSSSDPESLKENGQATADGFVFLEKRSRKKPKLQARRQFQIPQKVPERKHVVQDELTDLTSTFNEMSSELNIQYARLEERVRSRTAELEKSRDLARAADESKTLFIANVSHELRTPLNGIIGMCAVAMQEDELFRIRQSLNIVYKSSDLLLHLLNDLLTFSRNSYGQQLAIEEGVFRLADVGTQLVSIFEKQARDSDIGLKVVFIGTDQASQSNQTNGATEDWAEDAIIAKKDLGSMLKRVKTNFLAQGPAGTGPLRDMSLRGDKIRILQVLMNLVSNSLKFTPPHGQIEVRIKCKGYSTASSRPTDMEGDVKARKNLTVPNTPESPVGRPLDFDFEVEDTGPGVPEHMRQEIFKPFVQGDLGLSRKHGGTGLGLAICAQLASLMGGNIHLKSTVDIGSTFTMSLPLSYTKERVPSITGSLTGQPGSRRGSTKPASLGSSVRIGVLSNKSARTAPKNSNRAQPTSARASLNSGGDEKRPSTPMLEQLRVVGFSQPYLTDGKENADSERSHFEAARREREAAEARKNRLESIESADHDIDVPPNPVEVHDNAANGLSTLQTQTTTEIARSPLSPSESLGQTPSKTSNPPKPPLNIKILVAEDNKVNQEVIMRMLKLERVKDVTLAEDGQRALDIVKGSLSSSSDTTETKSRSPFQLIFMDIQMPNMDGIESTKRIRALGFDGPIVALTAFDHETNREACREAGMSDFVGKPIKRNVLRKVLDEYKPS